MQTSIITELLNTDFGKRADDILRKCVHCGFCTATCPTYQLLSDELDGPRGRIYQIKSMLEGQPADREILTHLDRCLSCRSCETTCPSGVDYAELIDIGRLHIEQQNIRPFGQKLARNLLGQLLPYKNRNALLFKLGSIFRFLLPVSLKEKAPIIRPVHHYKQQHTPSGKSVLLLEGCAQSTLSPNTNSAATALLQALGYKVIREPVVTCCGAVNQHLNQVEKAESWVLNNLSSWKQLDANEPLDAIVSTATGCGVMLKDYPKILNHISQDTQHYQPLIEKIKDISELFSAEELNKKIKTFTPGKQQISYHAPCTLTHGHKLSEKLFAELSALGYQLNIPQNAHLCCGSAGTYSLLQPQLSKQLRDNKLTALQQCSPEVIITANVGCEHHLNSAGKLPVIHWVELVANDIEQSC